MAFSDKLKQLREGHGLSQAALAKQIYVSRSAVAKWENGLGLPDDGNLLALCDYFNVKEEWLMEREDLKKQLRIDKKQLGHILLCAGGILVPALCVILGLCLTFTGDMTAALFLPPRSLFAMICGAGPNPPSLFFPEMKGVLIAFCLSAAVWAGTAVFSVLALALPGLRAKSKLCLFLEIGLIALSAVLFAALFAAVYLIVTPMYVFPSSF